MSFLAQSFRQPTAAKVRNPHARRDLKSDCSFQDANDCQPYLTLAQPCLDTFHPYI